MTECQNCKEVNVKVVNTYRTIGWNATGYVMVDEMECQDCGSYSQMERPE